jgi:UDP-N-acetylmuramate dehydrogenase
MQEVISSLESSGVPFTSNTPFGFTGLEFAGGIPGTVGGAVCMNAGAHGSDISQTLSRALIMNERGELITLEAKELTFGYRKSVIQHTFLKYIQTS